MFWSDFFCFLLFCFFAFILLGKTLSFGLPMLNRIITTHAPTRKRTVCFSFLYPPHHPNILPLLSPSPSPSPSPSLLFPFSSQEGGLKGLIITPTRELALQISDHLRKVSVYSHVGICTIVGGLAEEKQRRMVC